MTASSKALALLLAMTLTSCALWTPRVDGPKPPRLRCKERATLSPIPARPAEGAGKPAWQALAAALYDLVAERDIARDVTADCLDDARDNGLIR